MLLRLFNLWLSLMLIWLILNGSLAPEILAAGAGLTLIVTLLFAGFAATYSDIRLTPVALYTYFVYLAVFLQELAIANVNVMRTVFARKIIIHPGIVEIKTELKTKLGRLALANSITLTPGTLTVDIRGDSLFIHWMQMASEDQEAATKAIAAKFEKYLKVIYG